MNEHELRWEKRGLIYGPDGSQPWAAHSALQPTPLVRNDGSIRVYVGCRDADGASSVGFVDLDADDPSRVLHVSERPVLSPGERPAFDQDGVVPCAVAEHEGQVRLYYAGYERASDVRFRAYSGLAISTDGGTAFERHQRDPVLPPNEREQLFRAVHSIRFERGRWRAWYGAGSRFIPGATKTLPVYDIRYFESEDGIHFPEHGSVCIPLDDGEHRVGRPYVVERGGRYEMFYGAGTEALGYRLGYAESDDGLSWTRKDHLMGLTVSEAGWDSEMIGYPAMVSTGSGTYLFYTGNGYGRDGFGYAILKAPPAPPMT